MKSLLASFQEQFQSFAATYPTLAMVAIGLGGIFLCIVGYVRLNYYLREKAITLNDKRFALLMNVLEKKNLASIHPLRLELVFQRAYGHRLSSDELEFAFTMRNTSDILFDIRHGRPFAKLNSARSGYELRSEPWLSLRAREKIADSITYALLIPAILLAFLYTFFDPVVGATLLLELCCFFWVMMAIVRSLASAQRLLNLKPIAVASAELPSLAATLLSTDTTKPLELVLAKKKRAVAKPRATSENAPRAGDNTENRAQNT